MSYVTYKNLPENKRLVTLNNDYGNDMYKVVCLDTGKTIEILHLEQMGKAIESLNNG